MVIRYNPHARWRQAQRAVTDLEVAAVLRWYDTEVPAKYGRRNRYKTISGRRVRVTFDEASNEDYYVWTVTVDEVAQS